MPWSLISDRVFRLVHIDGGSPYRVRPAERAPLCHGPSARVQSQHLLFAADAVTLLLRPLSEGETGLDAGQATSDAAGRLRSCSFPRPLRPR